MAEHVQAPSALTQSLLASFHGDRTVIFVTSIAGHRLSRLGCLRSHERWRLLAEQGPDDGVGSWGIRVNEIAPGNVHTPMNAHLVAQPGGTEQLLDDTPAGRIREVHDTVPAVVFLASAATGYMYGTSMVVDCEGPSADRKGRHARL